MQRLTSKFFTSNLPAVFILSGVILFSPLIYGSITVFPIFIIEASSCLLFLLFSINLLVKERIALIKLPFWPLALFFVLLIFQFLVLPDFILNFLSPSTGELYRSFSFARDTWLSLSICPESSLKMLLQVLSFVVIFVISANVLNNESKIKGIIIVVVICGFLFSLYGVILRLSVPSDGASFSTFVNRNHFAAYLEMIIPLAFILVFISRSKSVRLIYVFMAAIMILALFFTTSRAGIVCFLISFFAMFIILSRKVPIKNIVVAFIILISIFLVFFFSADITSILGRIDTLAHPLKAYGSRLTIIKDSLGMFKDFTFFGTGLGTFGDIYQKYKTVGIGWHYVTRNSFAHNEPVQLLVETGLFGVLFFSAFLFLMIRRSLFIWWDRRNPFVLYVAAGCFVSLLAAFLHSLFDFTLHIPANAIVFFVILAILWAAVHLKSQNPLKNSSSYYKEIRLSKSTRIILAGICFCVFMFMENLIFKRFRAEVLVNNIHENSTELDDLDKILAYKKDLKVIDSALKLNSMNSNYYRKKADIFLKLASVSNFGTNLDSLAIGASKQDCLILAVTFYKKAIQLNPANAEYHFQLASVTDILGERVYAAEQYKQACKLDPTNFKIEKFVKEYLAK